MTGTANPFSRTRADHAREQAEDYVELVFRLGEGRLGGEVPGACECETAVGARTVDLARELGVAQPTVTKTLLRLEGEGLVCIHPRQFVHLTRAGRDMAVASLERHRLVVDFLVSIGVPRGQAEIDAEGIEHHVSEATLGAMRRAIAGP